MGERLCPSCRKPLSEGAKFCTECGSRIDVDFTRKALDDDVSDGNGLIISKDIQSVNPFYSKPDKLKDGILNPVLEPLPEKKKVVFREWNPSTDMEEEKKENRIITTPVEGGFRKREPQAEEVKDINSFFTRRNKRR
jgi:hypothetical protein